MTPKPSAIEALAELIAAWDTFNGKSIPESLYAAISNARAALATAPAEPPEKWRIDVFHARGCVYYTNMMACDCGLLTSARECFAFVPPKDGEVAALTAELPEAVRLAMLGDKTALIRYARLATEMLARLSAPVPDKENLLERNIAIASLHSIASAYTIPQAYKDAARQAITAFENLVADRDEWRRQHENLVEVRRRDLVALEAKYTTAPVPAREWLGEDDSDAADAARFRVLPNVTLAIVWRRPNPLLGDLENGYDIEALRVWTDAAMPLPPPPAADK